MGGGAKYGRILPGELTALGTNHGGVGKLLIYNGTISTPAMHKKGLCQQKATEFKKHMLKSCKLYQVHPVLMVSGSHRNSHYMRTNIEMSTPDSKSLVYWGASDFGVKISGFCGDRPVAKGKELPRRLCCHQSDWELCLWAIRLEVGFTIHSYSPWNLEKSFKIIWLFEMT